MADRLTVELERLAEELHERVVVPPFDTVGPRVRRRRAPRVVAGALAAVVAVVVALALAPGLPAPPEAEVAATGLPNDVAELVASPTAHVFEMAGGYDGSLALIWRNLVQPEPTFALVVRSASGDVSGRLLTEPLDLTAVPGGWVGMAGRRPWAVNPDASVSDLVVEEIRVRAASGDVVVTSSGPALVHRPGVDVLLPVEETRGLETVVVTSTGTTVGYEPGAGSLAIRAADGDTGTSRLPARASGAAVAGSGDHVSAIILGDAPDGSIPALEVVLTADSGRSLRTGTAGAYGIFDSTSLVVTDTGHTLSTGTDGALTVIDARGRVVPIGRTPSLRGLTVAGSRVYAVSATDDHGPLYRSDDSGATWTEDALPGLE